MLISSFPLVLCNNRTHIHTYTRNKYLSDSRHGSDGDILSIQKMGGGGGGGGGGLGKEWERKRAKKKKGGGSEERK